MPLSTISSAMHNSLFRVSKQYVPPPLPINFTINSINTQTGDIYTTTGKDNIGYNYYVLKSTAVTYSINFTCKNSGNIYILAVGGGGGGGNSVQSGGYWNGGGGGGGSVAMATFPFSAGATDTIQINIGSTTPAYTVGNNTTVNFTTNTSYNILCKGGGRGGVTGNGGDGGCSGGGALLYSGTVTGSSPGNVNKSSNTTNITYYGNIGGYPTLQASPDCNTASGGGGAGTVGKSLSQNLTVCDTTVGGNGGDGIRHNNFTGINSYAPYIGFYWGGGGGGGIIRVPYTCGNGGYGGGATGGQQGGSGGGIKDTNGITVINAATPGTNINYGGNGGINSGGGGGGGNNSRAGGSGGSGIVIIAFT